MEPETAEAAKALFLGESYGYWVQTVILFAAAILAFVAIRSSKITEAKKAAAEAIFASRRDNELIESIRLITTLHDGETNIAKYAKKEETDTKEAKSIKYALNHYEYVSVGIFQGIYDEEIFKCSSYTTVIRLYERTRPFIDAARKVTGANTTYQDLECLAWRWKNNPLKHKPLVVNVKKRNIWRIWK